MLESVRLGSDRSGGRRTPPRSSRCAVARHGGVDGQHQGPVARLGRSLHDVPGAPPVAEHVDLHPSVAVRSARRHVLERGGGERGEDHGRTLGRHSLCRGHLSERMGEAVQGGRGGQDRHAHRRAEDGRGGVDRRHVDQHVRVQPPAPPRRDVLGEEVLVLRAPPVVRGGHLADPATGQPLDVLEIEIGRELHGSGRAGGRLPSVLLGRASGLHAQHGRQGGTRRSRCASRMPSR